MRHERIAATAEALRDWQAQEAAGIPPDVNLDLAPDADWRLGSGWWIVPVLLLSCAAWAAIALIVAG